MKKLFLLSFLFAFFKYADAQNIILNPGFENSLNNWFYSATYSGVTQFSVDPLIKHSGSYSAKCEVLDSSNNIAVFAQMVDVVENHNYYFEYWVKAENIEQYMLPFVQFREDTNIVYETYFCPGGNTSDWQKLVARFHVPDSADNIVLFFGLFGSGSLWLDDFYMSKLTDTSYNQFTVDVDYNQGNFRHLISSNGIGPGHPSQSFNHIQKFHDLGIDYIRTHDYQTAFDYSVIFPDTSKSAFDSTAYNFHTTDSCIADIINAGGKVYYRFGESAHFPSDHNIPPYDKKKFADVCVQIIKHYNEGWNNGFYYNIDYFEIWNEPDLHDFWAGSVDDYIKLYRLTSKAIKQYNPNLKVGGPCVSNVFNESFFNVFIDSVVNYNLPIDFVSYHFYYYPNPYYFKYVNEYTRHKLESKGIMGVEYHNTEWNSYMFSFNHFSEWGMDDHHNAAMLVSAMNYMQSSTIDKFFRYSLDNWWFGMVSWDDQWRYSGLAMMAVNQLMSNNLKLYSTGSDTLGTTIMASENTSGSMIQVLISDNSSSANGYNLKFLNLEPGYIYNYEIYRIDSLNKYYSVATGTLDHFDTLIVQTVDAAFCDHIIIDKIVSNISVSNINNIIVYPNPAIDEINIIAVKINLISVYDFTGKLVKSTNSNKIKLYDMAKGIYFLEINADNNIFYEKIVVK